MMRDGRDRAAACASYDALLYEAVGRGRDDPACAEHVRRMAVTFGFTGEVKVWDGAAALAYLRCIQRCYCGGHAGRNITLVCGCCGPITRPSLCYADSIAALLDSVRDRVNLGWEDTVPASPVAWD